MDSGNIRRSSSRILARSKSLEAKFTFKTSISSPVSSPISSNFSSSSSSFSSMASSPGFFNPRASSQPSVTVYTLSNEFGFSIDRSISPSRSISATKRELSEHVVRAPKKTCMCSPTTHPGSFRCSMHKRMAGNGGGGGVGAVYNSNRLDARRSAMTNSLVQIRTVEGDLVRKALPALIRPSSHQQSRRSGFQPRPTGLSVMSRAAEPFELQVTAHHVFPDSGRF